MDRRLGEPEVMALPMARRDIADYLRLTIETVARALSILRDETILSFIGKTQRKIVLHDRRKLDQRAGSSERSDCVSGPVRDVGARSVD